MLGVENKKYIVLYEMAADDTESGNYRNISAALISINHWIK